MILFAADNHYDTHAGEALYECIEDGYDIRFHEDEWTCFDDGDLAGRYDLMMLNMISGSCDLPMPGPAAEQNVLGYLQAGRPLFLLHGASAAFWQWDWWRPIVGFRWVRGDDADGFEASHHPRQPYTIRVTKCRHPLCRRLKNADIPEDELYVEMEQTCPTMTLMETTTGAGTSPMCYETISPWGGRIVGYIPGHAPAVVRQDENVENCRTIVDYLLAG